MKNQFVFADYAVFILYFIIVASYGIWIYNKKKKAAPKMQTPTAAISRNKTGVRISATTMPRYANRPMATAFKTPMVATSSQPFKNVLPIGGISPYVYAGRFSTF